MRTLRLPIETSPWRWSVVGLGLICWAACGRGRSSVQQGAPSSSARPATLPSALVAPGLLPGPAPSAVARARPDAQRPETVLMAWNGALDRHAVDQLRPLYAASVLFYGQRFSASQVLEAKRKAFEKDPSFRQRISDVQIQKDGEKILIAFEKRSGKALEGRVYGSLVLEPAADGLKIVEESDAATDAKFRPRAESCPEAAMAITNAQPAVQADIARVAREYPEVNPGGFSYDQTEHTDRYSGSQGYFHPERYEPRWSIEAADGTLTIRDIYSQSALPLTAAQHALVKKLCTGKPDSPSEPDGDEQR